MNTEQTGINVFMYTINFIKLNIQKKRSLPETFKKQRNIKANVTRISKEKRFKNYLSENKNFLCKP